MSDISVAYDRGVAAKGHCRTPVLAGRFGLLAAGKGMQLSHSRVASTPKRSSEWCQLDHVNSCIGKVLSHPMRRACLVLAKSAGITCTNSSTSGCQKGWTSCGMSCCSGVQ